MSLLHVPVLSDFLAAAFMFLAVQSNLHSPSHSWWVKRERREWPKCGITSRTAAPLLRISLRNYARCLIAQLKVLRSHEPLCHGRENSQYPVTHSGFTGLRRPVAGTKMHFGTTSSMVYSGILRMKSILSN